MASKTQYSHFVICKVWVLGFTHHFTLHPLIWQIFSLISWLYFSTMWILWGRKCDYWVFHITHAKKGLPNHSSSTRDLKDFFSICDVENTILTYPPHSILSLPSKISLSLFLLIHQFVFINTPYLTDSYIGFTLNMESVSQNTIFGLKMMVISGVEKFIWNLQISLL